MITIEDLVRRVRRHAPLDAAGAERLLIVVPRCPKCVTWPSLTITTIIIMNNDTDNNNKVIIIIVIIIIIIIVIVNIIINTLNNNNKHIIIIIILMSIITRCFVQLAIRFVQQTETAGTPSRGSSETSSPTWRRGIMIIIIVMIIIVILVFCIIICYIVLLYNNISNYNHMTNNNTNLQFMMIYNSSTKV